MRLLRAIFFLITSMLLPVISFEAEIEGWVYSSTTREPVASANVVIEGIEVGTITDSNGFFMLRTETVGRQKISFRHIAYRIESYQIVLDEKDIRKLYVYLEPVSVNIDEVTVTSTRTEKIPFNSAATIYTVSSAKIRNGNLTRTTPESLNEVPGVMVQKTSNGQGSPYIRGFTGYRTLCMVDGIRLNNSVFRDGPNQYWNTIDNLSIGKMEMIKGPNSVLYGSDAIGGALNVFTENPAWYGDGFQWKRKVYYRFSSAENAHVARGVINGSLNDRFAFIFGYSYKNFGDVVAGGATGTQPKTGYDEWDADLKMEYKINETCRLIGVHQNVSQDDVWRTHKTNYGISWEGTTIGNEKKRALDQGRQLSYLQFQKSDLGVVADKLIITLSYQVQSEEQDRIKKDDKSDISGFDVNTLGSLIQMDKKTKLGKWTWGLEYYRDRVNSYLRKYKADGSLDKIMAQGPIADDSFYCLTGLFAQNDFKVTDLFDVVIGARYNYINLHAGKLIYPSSEEIISLNKYWQAFVGSARLMYFFGHHNKHRLYGGVSQGFRAPNLSDLSRFDSARSDEFEIAAPDLKPEKFLSYELGYKSQIEKLNLLVSGYYTDIDDMIVRTPTGNMNEDEEKEITKMNASNGFVYGFEAAFDWSFSDFKAWGNLGWMDGEIESYITSEPVKEIEPLSRMMPLCTQYGLRYQPKSKNFWVEGFVVSAAKQNKLAYSDTQDTQRIPPGGTPRYTVCNLRAGLTFIQVLNLSISFENIANKNYRIHGSGLNNPGRNLVVGVCLEF
ncbi:MAG: TonB-dependent receptor [Bacteroidales bacterium]|nr:TonB-dependent receptor [Bacteroidales bacterium]MCF8455670.1 TonB-dependent receptor [Bacteroidales bacterium]